MQPSPGESVAGRGGSLRWAVHELAPGTARTLRWGPCDEGLVQVLGGDVVATAAPLGTTRLDRSRALWLRGAWELELAATERAGWLEVRVEAGEGVPAAAPIDWERISRAEIVPATMSGRSVSGDGISAWLFDIEAGYRVDDLEHEEEQISVPVAGAFEMLVDGEGSPLAPGAVAYVPPWRRHGGDFAGAVTLLEVFSPPRRGELTRAL